MTHWLRITTDLAEEQASICISLIVSIAVATFASMIMARPLTSRLAVCGADRLDSVEFNTVKPMYMLMTLDSSHNEASPTGF